MQQQRHTFEQPYDVPSSAQLTRVGRGRSAPFDAEASALQAVNVHSKERMASLALGALSLAYAMARRSSRTRLLAALGSALVYRGMTGHCHMYQALGVSTARDA